MRLDRTGQVWLAKTGCRPSHCELVSQFPSRCSRCASYGVSIGTWPLPRSGREALPKDTRAQTAGAGSGRCGPPARTGGETAPWPPPPACAGRSNASSYRRGRGRISRMVGGGRAAPTILEPLYPPLRIGATCSERNLKWRAEAGGEVDRAESTKSCRRDSFTSSMLQGLRRTTAGANERPAGDGGGREGEVRGTSVPLDAGPAEASTPGAPDQEQRLQPAANAEVLPPPSRLSVPY